MKELKCWVLIDRTGPDRTWGRYMGTTIPEALVVLWENGEKEPLRVFLEAKGISITEFRNQYEKRKDNPDEYGL